MMARPRTLRPAANMITLVDDDKATSCSWARRNGSRALFCIVLTIQAAGALFKACNFVLAPYVQDAEYYVPPSTMLSEDHSPTMTVHTGANATPSVEFLATRDLNLRADAFAATWWQTRERFLMMNPDTILARSPEQAVFNAILMNADVRMTVDWLQFSVEHLSKWWKTADYDRDYSETNKDDPIAYHRIVTNLLAYIQKSSLSTSSNQHMTTAAMPDTLAVIAFMPYTSPLKRKPVWAKHLTIVNLAATIASLVQVGCGRVVVVAGKDHEQETLSTLQAAIRLLRKQSNSLNFLANDETGVLHQVIHQQEVVNEKKKQEELLQKPFLEFIGSTEIGFVDTNVIYPDNWNVNKTVKNVPRAALTGLHEALLGHLPPTQQERWLGSSRSSSPRPDDDSSAWKYVYLTEPDTLLQTRVDAFSIFQKAMDEGMILLPHRFQTIPHEYDLQGYKDARFYLPALGPFQNVSSIHAPSVVVPASIPADSSTPTRASIEHDNVIRRHRGACCDGGKTRPWQRYRKCENGFWYLCGFHHAMSLNITESGIPPKEDLLESHFLLFDYRLMQLSSGSNLVSLAGTEHGRRCFPQEHGECSIQYDHSTNHEQQKQQPTIVEEPSMTMMSWDEARILHSSAKNRQHP
jgi:hypothetical protein